MKKMLLLLVVAFAHVAHAQVPITQAQLNADSVNAMVAFYNDPGTTRLSGDSRVAAGSVLSGNVAVLDGSITVGGHITGDLLVINGDASFESGARVDGAVRIVGGTPHDLGNLSAQQVVWYRERLKYELRDGDLTVPNEIARRRLSPGKQFSFGRADLLIAARGGYNRSEGLPVYIGPRITTSSRNPLVVEALYTFRSAAAFRFDDHDYGYGLRIEQFFGGGRAARVGARMSSEVLPIEAWGLSDRENSLATFLLHEDHRDHYERDGASLYLASGRGGLPLEWRVEYGDYRYSTAALRDPVTLIDNPNPWRQEIDIPAVRLATLGAHLQYDTRNDNRDPAAGWLLRGEVETPLAVRSGDATHFDKHYQYGLIDVRRYTRLSPLSRLALRAIAAGSLDGDPLPAFRQQALGGEGSLPGYPLYRYDCRAHALQSAAQLRGAYGCDRLMLFQIEYQLRFPWLSAVGRRIGRDFGLLENIRGVGFFDSGRAWTEDAAREGRSAGTGDFTADAGFGLRFGTIGAYWAFPLAARARGFNFFVRLEPRF